MSLKQTRKSERGAALLLSIFALALVSAVGLALLFSSDTETSISANYRDKQVAIYAALSGLQEGRDRLRRDGDLEKAELIPNALPSTTAKNVLYIVNPAPGEDVKPWDKNNPYFDTELCQEGVMGLSGTAGTPCDPNSGTSIPSGEAWFNTVNSWAIKDASGATLSPLSYKWVRITLKADNMTPLKIPSGTGKQVCWDPNGHQIPLPAGSGTDCMPPSGTVADIQITDPGSGYVTAPTIQLDGGGGSGAAATATIGPTNSNSVASVSLVDGGKGYTTAPAVSITGGGGTGATAVATIGGDPIATAKLDSPGSPTPACYDTTAFSGLQVFFSGGGGAGATATLTPTGSRCVFAWQASGSCNKGKHITSVTGSGGSGTQFTGTISFDNQGNINAGSMKVSNPGNYAGCTGLKYTFTPGVQIQSINLQKGGDGYINPVQVTFAGATALGNPPTGSATLGGSGGANAGKVTNIILTSGGSGYTSTPVVTIAPPPALPGNATASGVASLDITNTVTGVTVNPHGQNYTTPPTVIFSDPPAGGKRATGVATLGSANNNYYGRIYLITAMAQTKSGARAMAQMEVAVTYDKYSFSLGGALTLAGPSPVFGTPNSQNFKIDGTDANSCGETKYAPRPSIGVYDDPNNPTTPTSVQTVLNALGKPNNYIGAQSAPDVENVFNSLGDGGTTPEGLKTLSDSVYAKALAAGTVYPSNPTSINLGTATNPVFDFIDGDYTMGPTTGYGVLLVTGTLRFNGDYGWNGLIFVIGKGASVMSGGGNGQINGSVFVADTNGGTSVLLDNLGAPTTDWAGGGGNGVRYDHCWADNLLAKIPILPSVSPGALKVLSVRMLDY
jgi:hypothetical protein